MRNHKLSRIVLSAFLFFLLNTNAFAQDVSSPGMSASEKMLIGLVIFLLVVCVGLAFNIMQLSRMLREVKREKQIPKTQSGLAKWWANLDRRFFTKAAPLEKEADVLLDHDYDGIKELDNALPPWWKWGFYITVVAAVFYLLRFHVWNTGPTPEQEYATEMQVAAAKLEEYKSKNKAQFDESTVTVADAAGIAAGKKVFTTTCFPCHGANGEGNAVGPNLTDKYWLHGGAITDVFRTINKGVPEKGMQAWGRNFSPEEIRNIASYVLSLQGSNPANAKAPQGDLYEPGKAADSTAVKKDSTATNPTQ